MNVNIKIPDGYRIMFKGEIIKPDDKFLAMGKGPWIEYGTNYKFCIGKPIVNNMFTHITKITKRIKKTI